MSFLTSEFSSIALNTLWSDAMEAIIVWRTNAKLKQTEIQFIDPLMGGAFKFYSIISLAI